MFCKCLNGKCQIISTLGTILGAFVGRPANRETLVNFYQKTKPFGFWKPIRSEFKSEDLLTVHTQNRRDRWLLIPACLWQLFLFWMMTAFVAKLWQSFFVSIAVIIVLSGILYKYWYKNLSAEDYKIQLLESEEMAQDKLKEIAHV